VITAHNYRTYFGKLKELEVGTEVIFTDAAGNRFEYKVAAVDKA
jgi:sortase A